MGSEQPAPDRLATDQPDPALDLLVLSPHLDDAALSCGATIHRVAQGGGRVLVVNVFTADAPTERSPLAADLHRRWALGEDAMVVRRREDSEACDRLGAAVQNLDFVDALYRCGASGEPHHPALPSLFGPPHPDDAGLVDRLAGVFRGLPPARQVLAPLGIGGHVDHRLVHLAACAGFEALEFYSDYPYARSPRAVVRALLRVMGPPWRWRPRRHPLGPLDLDAKVDAIARYRSQLGTAFPDRQTMESQVRRFSAWGEWTWAGSSTRDRPRPSS